TDYPASGAGSVGEGDGDRGRAGAGLEGDGAAVGGHDGLDQREAEPGAAGVPTGPGCVATGEPLESVLGQPGREAGAVVMHGEPARLGGDGDRRAARG